MSKQLHTSLPDVIENIPTKELIQAFRKMLEGMDYVPMRQGFALAVQCVIDIVEEKNMHFDGEVFAEHIFRFNTEKYINYFKTRKWLQREKHEDGSITTIYEIRMEDAEIFPELQVGEFIQFHKPVRILEHDIVSTINTDEDIDEQDEFIDDE